VELGSSIFHLTTLFPQGFLKVHVPKLLGLICQKYNMAYHCYADYIQLYLPLRCNDDSNITTLFECLNEIRPARFLHLNESELKV